MNPVRPKLPLAVVFSHAPAPARPTTSAVVAEAPSTAQLDELFPPVSVRAEEASPPPAPLPSLALGEASREVAGPTSLRSWLRRPHHAFGDARNRIQYGFEHEGEHAFGGLGTRRWGVLQYYRPAEVPDVEWRRMSLPERRSFVEDRQHPWSGLRRMDDAPTMLAQRLGVDGDGHEVTPAEPFSRLMDLLDATSFAKRKLEPGGFTQYNTSFRHDPAYARELTDFTAHAADYVTWRMFAGSPRAVRNWRFGAFNDEQVRALGERFSRPDPRLDTEFKMFSFAPRTGETYGPGRVNFELRAITNNVPDARRVVLQTDRFLEDPRGAVIKLGRKSRGVTAAQLAGVERVGKGTLQRLSSDVRALFNRVSMGETNAMLGGIHELPTSQRWALPMVAWEKRPGMPPDAQRLIVSERARFVDTLEALAKVPDEDGRAKALREALDEAVHQFARRTALHEYL